MEIRVRDNGIGIPAEIKDRLFQPFFTTKPPGEGTGLGLSMSYDIITQQHGGSISVDSKVGEYSEFTVRPAAHRDFWWDCLRYCANCLVHLHLQDCFDELNRFGKGDRFAQRAEFSLRDPDASSARPHSPGWLSFSGHLEWPVDLHSFHKLRMQRSDDCPNRFAAHPVAESTECRVIRSREGFR